LAQLCPLDLLASFSYFEIGLGVLSAPLLVVERSRDNISANSNDKRARERQGEVAYKKGEAIVFCCFFLPCFWLTGLETFPDRIFTQVEGGMIEVAT
jgi:hypothetical protein